MRRAKKWSARDGLPRLRVSEVQRLWRQDDLKPGEEVKWSITYSFTHESPKK